MQAARGALQFLVLDELHTYRGRQGADVSLLVRRVRDVCENERLQCVGTSATLAGGGTFAEQQTQIAKVGSRIFGAPVRPERVIGETLRRVTDARSLDDPSFLSVLRQQPTDPNQRPLEDHEAFCADSLSIWIESVFGLAAEPGSGRLCRATPIGIAGPDGAARKLAETTSVPEEACQRAIQDTLLAGYLVHHPETGFPVFAFRLHQFISRGDTVYTSLEEPAARYVTTQGQQYVPDDRFV